METILTAEEILIDKVGKLALSGLKWKSLDDRKQRIIEAMTEFASQESDRRLEEYKEKLRQKIYDSSWLDVIQRNMVINRIDSIH